jgi:hypothetical protein
MDGDGLRDAASALLAALDAVDAIEEERDPRDPMVEHDMVLSRAGRARRDAGRLLAWAKQQDRLEVARRDVWAARRRLRKHAG